VLTLGHVLYTHCYQSFLTSLTIIYFGYAKDCIEIEQGNSNHNLPPDRDPSHSVTLRLSVKPMFTHNIVLGTVDSCAKCGSVDDVERWHDVTIFLREHSLREHIPS
jgi:hypothetical protein